SWLHSASHGRKREISARTNLRSSLPATVADDANDTAQSLGWRRFAQQQPFEQILVFLTQHLLVKHLIRRCKLRYVLLNKRYQQQVQLQHPPATVPEEFLVFDF